MRASGDAVTDNADALEEFQAGLQKATIPSHTPGPQ
jgi:hypothetical protein